MDAHTGFQLQHPQTYRHFADISPTLHASKPSVSLQHFGDPPLDRPPGNFDGDSAASVKAFTGESQSEPITGPSQLISNAAISFLTPWTVLGTRIFVDICSGFSKPLSVAVGNLGIPTLAVDILLHDFMDLLNDVFYEQLLRLLGSGVSAYTATSPPCTEYSLLKLRPGGPRALRTPSELDGILGLSLSEAERLQNSAFLLDRSASCASLTYTAGGHAHVEQPPGAMSWREVSLQHWLIQGSCALVIVAACGYSLDIKKSWLFASSFHDLKNLAVRCEHPPGSHVSIAGTRDEHGVYLSRHSAIYPDPLVALFASVVSVLFSPSNKHVSWDNAFQLIPQKTLSDPPHSFCDGGGLTSTPDWSRPPALSVNIFRNLREHWLPILIQQGWPQRILRHFASHENSVPFPQDMVTSFRESLNTLLPVTSSFDWTIREDQPLCLLALQQISSLISDPDTELFSALLAGVPTGFCNDIPPSNIFSTKTVIDDSNKPELSIHMSNWHSAESNPDITAELIQAELDKGWLIEFPGSVDDAKLEWPTGLAVGKLGITFSETRPPRLVVDSSICGTNSSCQVLEHQQLPSAKDVQRVFPLRCNKKPIGALGLDVKSAHKLIPVRHSERGLLGFSFQRRLFFYKVCPFGAVFSAHWWGRLGSFWVRFLHQLIYVAHAIFLFVDDFMILQPFDVLPATAALVTLTMQAFCLPISWKKAELDSVITWIGWHFDFRCGTIRLQTNKQAKLLSQIKDMLNSARVHKKQLEKFLGLALWITQLFPYMRSYLHWLYADLHSAPGTSYSVDPGFWITTLACLNESLQFVTRPVGTGIPEGSKLLSVRHQPVKTLEDVRSCRLSEKRTWIRVLDPTSQRRKLSENSKRILHMFQHWLQFLPPAMSMYPKPVWQGEAAADACAHSNRCQVGGFLRFMDGSLRWFSQAWHPEDFTDLGVPVSTDMQKDISCYETLAQMCLLFIFCRMTPGNRVSLTLKSVSDNTGAEAGSNKLFSTKFPLCLFLERLCLLSSFCQATLDVSHISGPSNELADAISRWNDQDLPPFGLKESDRITLSLSQLWFPKQEITVYPHGSTLSWPLPSLP